MIRWGICIIIVSLATGCAAQNQPVAATPKRVYTAAAAGALAFDPPVSQGQPALDLSRDNRTPDAFVGYETTSINYTYLRTDDRFADDGSERFERRVISTKVGITYR